MNPTDEAVKPYRGRAQKARKARIKVDLWCEIHGRRDRAVGHIRNLTVGGCRILSPSAFPLKETIAVVLAGPPTGPDLHLKGQLRWLGLNPGEGPFELGVEFVHSGETAKQVERMLRAEIKRNPVADDRSVPSYAKFAGGLDAVKFGTPSAGELRRTAAAEGLDRLTRRDPSAPLP